MPQPNIILIIGDDLPYEAISRMPYLFSKLSDNGVFFSKCFTATSLCQPGRSTLFTGQYAHNHGVLSNSDLYTTLNAAALLPKRLQAAGYKTSLIGKYMNSYLVTDPVPQGWDEWHGMSPQDYYNYDINDNGVVSSKGSALPDYQTTVVTDKALSFIASTTEPFFMALGYVAPHFNGDGNRYHIDPHPDYIGCVPTSKQFERFPDWNLSDVSTKPNYIKALPPIDGATEVVLDAFWRGVTETLFSMSKAVDQLVDGLIAAGKYDNTYIIFVSDNGTMYGEQRITTGKIVPYETSIHIPLIVSGPPARMAQDKTCPRLTSHVDIAATIYDLAGATSTLTLDGVSLVPYLQNPQAAPVRDHVFIEWLSSDVTPAGNPIYRGVRSNDWKYIEYATGEKELYDMRTNPYELTNTASLPENAGTVAALSALIAQGTSCSGAGCML